MTRIGMPTPQPFRTAFQGIHEDRPSGALSKHVRSSSGDIFHISGRHLRRFDRLGKIIEGQTPDKKRALRAKRRNLIDRWALTLLPFTERLAHRLGLQSSHPSS